MFRGRDHSQANLPDSCWNVEEGNSIYSTKEARGYSENRYFSDMKVTATKLANDSESVLDRVIQRGETAKVERHGKTVVKIRRKAGANRDEIVDLLNSVKFTKGETKELKKAMDAASDVIGYAGRP